MGKVQEVRKLLFLLTTVLCSSTVGCVNQLATNAMYPFDLVNRQKESKSEIISYTNPSGPVIFYLHGNGENLEMLRPLGQILQRMGHVVMAEYPGLGPLADQKPSQDTIMKTIRARYQDTRKTFVGSGRRIFIVGRSLGAAVAAQLSSDGADGLLLISPWSTAREEAKSTKLGFLSGLAGSFFRDNEWNTLEAVKGFKNKRAVIHGDADDLIPFFLGEKVALALGVSITKVSSKHNDIYTKTEVWDKIEEFLK